MSREPQGTLPGERRADSRGAVVHKDLVAWMKDVWPGARPSPDFQQAGVNKGELYYAIQSVIVGKSRRSLHVRTIGNVLRGKAVAHETASRIAKAILVIFPDDPVPSSAPEVADDDGARSALSIEGVWNVRYVEDDRSEPPHVTLERAFVDQAGLALSGRYECISYDRHYRFEFTGRVTTNTVVGRYFVPERRSAVGEGVFQLLASREDQWLEGYCTWFDLRIPMMPPCHSEIMPPVIPV